MIISVIICSHNPRPDYLARVLAALQEQTLPLSEWELLLIDNASTEPLAARFDLSWHPNARHIHEEELGLTPARLRGIAEAVADLLIFADDDNLLSCDYLAEAMKIGNEWPQLGTWGGSIHPEFEIVPPEYLRPYLGYLALREVKTERWSNISSCSESEPWGVGLCIRKNVALAYRDYSAQTEIQITDRRGRDLISGGDTEISYVSCSLGLGMGIFPQLKATHLIPRERLNERYLLHVAEGIGTSCHLIAYKWHGQAPRSPFSGWGAIRVAKNYILKHGVERRFYFAGQRAIRRARQILSEAKQG